MKIKDITINSAKLLIDALISDGVSIKVMIMRTSGKYNLLMYADKISKPK